MKNGTTTPGAQEPEAAPPPRREEPRLRRILVPIDYAASSEKALAYAVFLGREFGSEVILLHVVQPVPFVPENVAVNIDLISAEAQEAARERLAALRRQVPEAMAVRMIIREGAPGHEIVRAGEELSCELIVLSTHGRTGVSRVLMGSVVEEVTRTARSPVLVVRDREMDFIDLPESAPETGETKGSTPS